MIGEADDAPGRLEDPADPVDPRIDRVVHGLRVVIDRDLCVGFGDCVTEAPVAFDLDDEGIAVLTMPEDVHLSVLMDACAACPVDAITVYEDGVAVIP